MGDALSKTGEWEKGLGEDIKRDRSVCSIFDVQLIPPPVTGIHIAVSHRDPNGPFVVFPAWQMCS